MKEFLLNTGKQPCAVKVVITTDGANVPFYLVGYNPYSPRTFFFQSRFLVSGREEIIMNCPMSPRMMKVVMWMDMGTVFYVHEVSLLPLTRPTDIPEWVSFIERFSLYCGNLWPGRFKGDNVPFEIEYIRHIMISMFQEHTTPARIAVDRPVIQVSKFKFDSMSIPQRVIILTHEVAHNFINNDPDSEIESDDNGLLIYKYLGYPKIEAINAFSEIMSDTDSNVRRMMNLINI